MQDKYALPRFVHVLGQKFTVTEQDQVFFPDDGTPIRGLIIRADQIIQVDRNQHPETRAETLLHECIHAVEDALGLDFEEAEVGVLSRGLFALLRDNPALVRAVTA